MNKASTIVNHRKTIVSRSSAAFLTLACIVCGASQASATTVLIDWSTAQSPSSPDTNGNYWNSLGTPVGGTSLGTTALVTTANSASGWSVAVSNTDQTVGFSGTGANGPAGSAPFNVSQATIDGIYANASVLSEITFTGLGASKPFDFSAIGGRATTGVNGLITVLQGTPTGGPSFGLLNDGTVLNFSVTSSAAGEIVMSFGRQGSSGVANFNALQITAVPEPSTVTIGLFFGGTLAGLRYARGRQRQM